MTEKLDENLVELIKTFESSNLVWEKILENDQFECEKKIKEVEKQNQLIKFELENLKQQFKLESSEKAKIVFQDEKIKLDKVLKEKQDELNRLMINYKNTELELLTKIQQLENKAGIKKGDTEDAEILKRRFEFELKELHRNFAEEKKNINDKHKTAMLIWRIIAVTFIILSA